MPSYKITFYATRDGRNARSFARYVTSPTARDARATFGNRPIQDMADMAWFDEWRITDTRKVVKYEVVATDTSAWHSNGIASVTVEYGKRAANERLRIALANSKPGQGAFIRPAK
jgi:hypothetical protein